MSLIFSLDYDKTFTEDEELWYKFIDDAQYAGHTVYVVTMRDEKHSGKEVKDKLAHKVDGIFFTGLKSKRKFMEERGININIWIDDTPDYIVKDF